MRLAFAFGPQQRGLASATAPKGQARTAWTRSACACAAALIFAAWPAAAAPAPPALERAPSVPRPVREKRAAPVVPAAQAPAADVAPSPPVVSAAAAAEPDKRRGLRLAVYPLKADAPDARLAEVATDGVATEIRKLERVSVVAMDEIKAMLDLEAEKQLAGCADDSCLAEIADSLGVDGLVIGSVARVGDQLVFGLKRIDQRTASVVASATKTLPSSSGDAVLAAVGPVVAELFPDVQLKPGMTRGVDASLLRRLYPPPVPVWLFATNVAVTAALALGAGGALAVNLGLAGDYRAFLESSIASGEPVPGQDVKGREGAVFASGVTTLVLASAALTSALVAGGLALFTDWDDERSAGAAVAQ